MSRVWEGMALTGAMTLVVTAAVFLVLAGMPRAQPWAAGAPRRLAIPEMGAVPAIPEAPMRAEADGLEVAAADADAVVVGAAEPEVTDAASAIATEVAAGRAVRARDRRAALAHFEQAARFWERDAHREGAARVRNDVAEAYFELAEDKARRFEATRLEVYSGDGSVRSIQSWAEVELVGWLARKRRALDVAEGAYGKVARVEVPSWTVKSASRVGQLYRAFADAFPGPLVPGDEPVCDGFVCYEPRMLDAWRARFYEQARVRFEACLELAVSLHVSSGAAGTCQRELDRLEPGRPRTAPLPPGRAHGIDDTRQGALPPDDRRRRRV